MISRRTSLALHIVGCMIFLALPLVLSPHPPEEIGFLTSPPTIRDFLANGLMLAFFYVNYYFLIPGVYFRKKYVMYGLCVGICFLVMCTLPSYLTGRDPFAAADLIARPPIDIAGPGWMPPVPEGSTLLQEIKHHIYLFMAVVLFSVLLRVRLRLMQSEHAKHEAELVALKDQINPHFLFNTLNGLYGLAVRDKSTPTATGILKLSGMMRYVVSETGKKHIGVEKEISYINDYIELQKLRLDKRIQLSYKVVGSISRQQIAPLILMPFIENAFKHGVNPDENSNINILIEVNDQEMRLTVENNKVKVALAPFEKSGRGLENTKSRLNLLYPSRHFLILSEDERCFRVQLTIQW